MILVNNTLVQGQHDFYKRVGIVLPEDDSEDEGEKSPVLNPNPDPEQPILDPSEAG